MEQFSTLSITQTHATLVNIRKESDFFYVEDAKSFPLKALNQHLHSKRKLYVTLYQEDVIDEKISIASSIKSKNLLKNSLMIKLKESVNKKSYLFNFEAVHDQQSTKTTTYQVDGVYESDYSRLLHGLGHFNDIVSASTDKFSFFAIAQQCVKEQSYFAVHTMADKILSIVVDRGEILYSRSNTIVANNAEIRILNMVDEIRQTYNYVRQQFRNIRLNRLYIGGSLAIDDLVAEQLEIAMPELSIAVLYPNSFIRGIEYENLQEYLLSLGSYFVPKKYHFLPSFILGARTSTLLSKISLAASALFLATTAYMSLDVIQNYLNSIDRYESIKQRLVNMAERTDTYSIAELQEKLNYLNSSQEYSRYHPSDLLIDFAPLFELVKPQNIDWKRNGETVSMELDFKKEFETLESLYTFENLFYKREREIETQLISTINSNTDYTKKIFGATLLLQNSQESQEAAPRQRRRR